MSSFDQPEKQFSPEKQPALINSNETAVKTAQTETDEKRLGVVDSVVNPTTEQMQRIEAFKKEYQVLLNLRDERLQRDLVAKPELSNMKDSLDTHNQILERYFLGQLPQMVEGKGISQKDAIVAKIALIFHDSGKLNSPLLEHHIKSAEYVEELLQEQIGKEFEGLALNEEIIKEVKDAILRHMNHPYLKAQNTQKNPDKPFPDPETMVDRIVFELDMLSNVGFKNVGFRLISEDNIQEDMKKASEKGTSYYREVFQNVLSGVSGIKDLLQIPQIGELGDEMIKLTGDIFNQLDFSAMQSGIGDREINIAGLKEYLNDKIQKVGNELISSDPKRAKLLGYLDNLKI